jgi:hypothetical protein
LEYLSIFLVRYIPPLQKQPFGPIGFGKALQCGWVTTETREGVTVVVRKVGQAEDTARQELAQISEGRVENVSDKAISQLKKRKWISEMWAEFNPLLF